ncbi:phage integrase family protein [Breoghania corrubedonensis]|uniref:Phage integrase family protein n=2 Tax=Breoghania corrubedonensis TaxID=665038 RepID=A0A2T5VA97_9HYPH|nr:phage integrase family protein [Breoghania corrubedonensis]
MLSVRKAWANSREDAGLGPDVVPHTLRHTTATWGMQNKADLYQFAGFLGMSVKMLNDVYGHHHPGPSAQRGGCGLKTPRAAALTPFQSGF